MLFQTLQRLSIDNSWQSNNTSKHLYITLQKEAVSQLKEHNIAWQLRIRSEEIVFYWFASNWCFLNMVIRKKPSTVGAILWRLSFPKWDISLFLSIALQPSLKSTRNNIHNPFHLFYPLGIKYIIKNDRCVRERTSVVSCPWWLIYMTFYLTLYVTLYSISQLQLPFL